MENQNKSNQSQTIISAEEIQLVLINFPNQKKRLKQFILDQSALIDKGLKQGILSVEKINSILA